MADDLVPHLLGLLREQLPDVGEDIWRQIEQEIRRRYGAERHYIARRPKRLRLEALAEADAEADAQRLAQLMGVSVRRVQQLRRLG